MLDGTKGQISRRKFLQYAGGGIVGLTIGGALSRGAFGAQLSSSIKIGGVFPLTGAVAREGREVKDGAELARDLINGEGGIAGEVQIELAFEDSKCNPDEGARVARRLIDADFVMGDFCSSAALAEQPIFAAAGIPQIVFAFATTLTGEARRQANAVRSVRLGPQAKTEMAPLAKYAASVNGDKRFFAIGQNTDFGRSMVEEFEKVLNQLGGEIIQKEFTTPFKSDFTPELTKVKASEAEALLAIGLAFEEINLANQYRELDLTQTFYGSDLLNDVSFKSAVAEAGKADGFFFPWVFDNGTNLRTFPRVEPEPGAKAMNNAFIGRRGRPATRNNGWGWGSVQLVKQAIEAANSVNARTVTNHILSGAKFDLPYGTYGFLPCGQADMRTGVATYSQAQVILVADRSFGDDVVTDLC
ncbi:MAG: ABC transporter substrate-binding protein [Candidatus Bipolaricaulia bacterium]